MRGLGRMGRLRFWAFAVPVIAGAFATFWLLDLYAPDSLGDVENPAFWSLAAYVLLVAPPFIVAALRRFHDANVPGGLALIPAAVLILGLAVGAYDAGVANRGVQYAGLGGAIIAYGGFLLTFPILLGLLLLPSTPGPNRYGPAPRVASRDPRRSRLVHRPGVFRAPTPHIAYPHPPAPAEVTP